MFSELGGSDERLIVCPVCSHTRKAHNRKKKVLKISRVEDGCVFFCHHCNDDGCHFPDGSQPRQQAGKRIDQRKIWAAREAAFKGR